MKLSFFTVLVSLHLRKISTKNIFYSYRNIPNYFLHEKAFSYLIGWLQKSWCLNGVVYVHEQAKKGFGLTHNFWYSMSKNRHNGKYFDEFKRPKSIEKSSQYISESIANYPKK